MAQLGLSGVTPALNTLYLDEIAAQFRQNASPLLVLMQHVAAANATCTWTVKFDDRDAGGAYAAGAGWSDSEAKSNIRATASHAWANYREAIDVADETIDIVAATGGAEGTDLMMSEAFDAVVALAKNMSTDLYAGDPTASPAELAGLATMVASSGTFAGVNPATSGQGQWVSADLSDVAAGSYSIASHRALLRAVKDDTGREPTLTIGNGGVTDVVKGLSDSGDAVKRIRTQSGFIDVESALGTSLVTVDGVPHLEDPYCTAGEIYAVTLDDLQLKYIPVVQQGVDEAMIAAAMSQIVGREITAGDVADRLRQAQGLFRPVMVYQGKDGSKSRALIRSGNVQVANRTRHGFARRTITGL